MMQRLDAYWRWIAAGLALTFLVILIAMGRPAICPCGHVSLWHFVVQSPENSQQIIDWYTPSHIIHGFIFYGLGRWLLKGWPVGLLLCAAIFLEGGWEILENSPIIIDRYREVTISWGYAGDSILNSLSDLAAMMVGFAFAANMRWQTTVAIALLFELFTAYMIRDNLALNILMLAAPSDAVKNWQAGASGPWVNGK